VKLIVDNVEKLLVKISSDATQLVELVLAQWEGIIIFSFYFQFSLSKIYY
jgi:hypothetical protein